MLGDSQSSDPKPSIPVAVGILVGLLASFVQSLGLTIQRKSHMQNDLKPIEQRKKSIRRPLWLIGFAIFISSNLFGTVFQIGALPIVILAPLGAVSLLWNALLSRFLLGEIFSPTTLLGTVLIATGAVLIAVFGVVPEQNHSLDELLELFARPAFVAYFTLMAVGVGGVLLLSHATEYGIRRSLKNDGIELPHTPEGSPIPSDYGTPIPDQTSIPFRITRGARRWSAPSVPPVVPGTLPAPTLGDEHPTESIGPTDTVKKSGKHVTLLLPRSSSQHSDRPDPVLEFPSSSSSASFSEPREPSVAQSHTLTLLGMSFAACSGTLSGMCLLFAKCAVELLILSFAQGGKNNQFNRFQSWVLVSGLAVAALAQLFYLNHSLRLAGPALICPLAFCFYNISSIFDGLVFYSQFSELAAYQIALVTIGIVVLLVGVWSVSATQPTGQGGVEVGGWADELVEEEECLISETYTDEPQEDSALTSEPPTPIVEGPPSPTITRTGDPSVFSPTSPTFRRRRSDTGRRRSSIQTRFGTLIPELAPAGVPAGFSIGLNTSSPGFVLRAVSHVQDYGDDEASGEGGPGRRPSWIRRRTKSLGPGQGLKNVELGEEGASGLLVTDSEPVAGVRGKVAGAAEEEATEAVTERESWGSWARRVLGRRGKGAIRLREEEE